MSWHVEARLAEALGLDRELVKTTRQKHLESVEDYTLKSNLLVLTDQAVVRLLAALGVKLKKRGRGSIEDLLTVSALHEKDAPAVTEAVLWRPADQLLECVRTTNNRQVLLARFHDLALAPKSERYHQNGVVRVRVRSTEKFVAGMTMNCRWIQADLWELVGRGPRFRGRW